MEKYFKEKSDGKIDDNSITVKGQTMKVEDDKFTAKDELSQIGAAIKKTNKKMKASFKSVKTLMRDQHFQTHIQFPVASLILHLEYFLSSPSNATEEDLRLTCTKTLPNTILKNLELMLKDNFLIHQSNNNPKTFVKLEKGIILMFKQLIFAQSFCLQLRNFGTVEDKFGLNLAKSFEYYIKKQKMEVQTKYNLNTVFFDILSNVNDLNDTDSKSHNASLFENVGAKLCQKTKAATNIRNVDLFLTRESFDFTVISKNRYFENVFNGWKIFAFYPKFSLKHSNQNENDEVDEDGEESSAIIQNQIIFTCKNQGHCSLIGGDLSGMFCNGKHLHYAICGNVGVTIGNPISESFKASELTDEEKEELSKWEKTKSQLQEFLETQKIKNGKKREIKKEKIIEKTVAKFLSEMEKKEEAKISASAFLSSNTNNLNFAFVTFLTIVYYCFY